MDQHSEDCVLLLDPLLTYFGTQLVCAVCIVLVWHLHWNKRRKQITNLTICLIEEQEECGQKCTLLRSDIKKCPVLGFDAEWANQNKNRQPVALLQLCSSSGNCCLFRLNKFTEFPEELRELLQDENVFKVGIVPENDALLILKDYGVHCKNTLDLRHLYRSNAGLAKLSKQHLNIELNKDTKVRCSNWETNVLTPQQVHYAAMDAYAAIKLYKKWVKMNSSWLFRSQKEQNINMWLNVKYRSKQEKLSIVGKTMTQKQKKSYKYFMSSSNKVIYDNCVITAPDGTLLSTVRQSKVQWYLRMGLAEVSGENPVTVRLLFEPKKKPKENEHLFEKEMKKNQCVVCGCTQKLLKHYVVPKTLRKFFPTKMKSKCSHDIVVFCVNCHLYSQHLRKELIKELHLEAGWKVPPKDKNDNRYYKCKSALALLKDRSRMPAYRVQEIEEEIKLLDNVTTITDELLTKIVAENTVNHNKDTGSKEIVDFYSQDGRTVFQLIRKCRLHFIERMNPKFLPTNWSVDYTNE